MTIQAGRQPRHVGVFPGYAVDARVAIDAITRAHVVFSRGARRASLARLRARGRLERTRGAGSTRSRADARAAVALLAGGAGGAGSTSTTVAATAVEEIRVGRALSRFGETVHARARGGAPAAGQILTRGASLTGRARGRGTARAVSATATGNARARPGDRFVSASEAGLAVSAIGSCVPFLADTVSYDGRNSSRLRVARAIGAERTAFVRICVGRTLLAGHRGRTTRVRACIARRALCLILLSVKGAWSTGGAARGSVMVVPTNTHTRVYALVSVDLLCFRMLHARQTSVG